MKQPQRSECLVKPLDEGARGGGQAAHSSQSGREGRCRTRCQRPWARCPYRPPGCAGGLVSVLPPAGTTQRQKQKAELVPPVLERGLRKSKTVSGSEFNNRTTQTRLNSFLNVSFHQPRNPQSPGPPLLTILHAPGQSHVSGLRELQKSPSSLLS